LSDGKILDFNDQRLFASCGLWMTGASFPLSRIRPEPEELTLEQFRFLLAAKKTKIKPLLLDQTFISGIGNLYAAECLFRARIHARTQRQ